MSSSCLVLRRLLVYVAQPSGGASTQSAFLYAAMTVLSRAVSSHQPPGILIAQSKSQSKLWPPHPHREQSNRRRQRAREDTRGANYHRVAFKEYLTGMYGAGGGGSVERSVKGFSRRRHTMLCCECGAKEPSVRSAILDLPQFVM